MQTNEEKVADVGTSEYEDFAFFTELPKCRGVVIPFSMIEVIHVDFSTGAERLVVQLKKGERNEGS